MEAEKVLKDQGRLQTPTKVKRCQLAIHRLRSRKSHWIFLALIAHEWLQGWCWFGEECWNDSHWQPRSSSITAMGSSAWPLDSWRLAFTDGAHGCRPVHDGRGMVANYRQSSRRMVQASHELEPLGKNQAPLWSTAWNSLVASRRMTTFGIVTYLLVAYSPGGVSEKQNILRSLEEPSEIQSLNEAPGALRRWLRWRNRAKEIGAVPPDPALQLKGLLKMSKKQLESQRELQFRVSLVRSGLGVDTTPNDTNVEQFAYHLLAEFEQLALTEKKPGASTAAAKGEQPKLKSLEAERTKAKKGDEETGRSPTKGEEGKDEKPKGRFFLTDQGCKRGKACNFSHDVKDEKRRCWNCSCPDHTSRACTRPENSNDTSPQKPPLQKVEGEEKSPSSP